MSRVRWVETLSRGHVRIETDFLYLDGAYVDLFVVCIPPPGAPLEFSDLGQTMALLLDHGYGATLNGSAIEKEAAAVEEAIVLLGQACLRVSELLIATVGGLEGDATCPRPLL